MVPGKGARERWIAQQIERDLRKLGYRHHVILKSDGEPAITDLISEVARIRKGVPTTCETSASRDSRANGLAERAVRSVEEQIRVLLLGFEEEYGGELSVKHALFSWLVEHSADSLNKFIVGADGRTVYERAKGHQYHGEMYEFGECIQSKVPGKPDGGLMKARWLTGIWLGKRWGSDEHIVSIPGGKVVRTRTVRPVPEGETWNKGLCDELVGVPSDPHGRWQGDIERPPDAVTDVPRMPVDRPPTVPYAEPVARRVLISRAYLDKFGFTEGCSKCRAVENGDETQPTLAHSKACRDRIEAKLREDPVLKRKIEKADARRDHFLAKEVEREDDKSRRIDAPKAGEHDGNAMEEDEVKTSTASSSGQRGAKRAAPETGRGEMADTSGVPVPETAPPSPLGTAPRSPQSTVTYGSDKLGSEVDLHDDDDMDFELPQADMDGNTVTTGATSSTDTATGATGTLPMEASVDRKRDRDPDEGPGDEGRGDSSALAMRWDDMVDDSNDSTMTTCVHCNVNFGSINLLFRHARQLEDEKKLLVTDQTFGNSGSVAFGLARTDEEARVEEKHEDLDKRTHSETQFDVCEIFSPARVCEEARKCGLKGGFSIDLAEADPITGRTWDLSKPHDRRKVRALVLRHRPKLLVLSPPCTLFSLLQNLAPGGLPHIRCPMRWKEALEFLEFAVEMCRLQMKGGRGFVLEHPWLARSWEMEPFKSFSTELGVLMVRLDMCRYGMTSCDQDGVAPVYKPTRLLTNVGPIAEIMAKTCLGGHRHVHLISGRAKAAAIYPQALCRQMIRGYQIWENCRVQALNGCMVQTEDMCDPEDTEYLKTMGDNGWYVDDISGKELNPTLARKARQEELDVFEERQVYTVVPRSSLRPGSKIIGVRWVEVNKGTTEKPRVRSRLVCQEFNSKGNHPDELFAPTPPVMATRWLISEAASQGRHGPSDLRLMVLDFKRAFLYADIKREVFIELPDDDARKAGGSNVGLLHKAMYGTRDAPSAWQKLVRESLESIGFEASKLVNCLYFSNTLGIWIVAHVDDFLVLGNVDNLMKLKKKLQERFEVDGEVLGPVGAETQEVKFLGRTIRWTRGGLEWEGDPKHVEGLIQDEDMRGAKGVETPGVKHEETYETEELSPPEAAAYRRGCARVNYIAQDRADLAYASKELSRTMSKPMRGDEVRLKRVVRYLAAHPRWVLVYNWQDRVDEVVAFTDSDWGGCVRTRKSTSGGVIMRGTHCIMHWSRTQQLISLSSAEAELNASITAGCEGLFVKHMTEELGCSYDLMIRGDSSANDGIVHRSGTGRIKHLSIRQLWLQERVRNKELEFTKIPREINMSDTQTHHWTQQEGKTHFTEMHAQRRAVAGAPLYSAKGGLGVRA